MLRHVRSLAALCIVPVSLGPMVVSGVGMYRGNSSMIPVMVKTKDGVVLLDRAMYSKKTGLSEVLEEANQKLKGRGIVYRHLLHPRRDIRGGNIIWKDNWHPSGRAVGAIIYPEGQTCVGNPWRDPLLRTYVTVGDADRLGRDKPDSAGTLILIADHPEISIS